MIAFNLKLDDASQHDRGIVSDLSHGKGSKTIVSLNRDYGIISERSWMLCWMLRNGSFRVIPNFKMYDVLLLSCFTFFKNATGN